MVMITNKMQTASILNKNNLECDYDLELQRVVKEIKKTKAKTICIQLPDGLKPKATEIADFIEKNTNCSVSIWFGSCYGSCDIPDLKNCKVDLLVQFGHDKKLNNKA